MRSGITAALTLALAVAAAVSGTGAAGQSEEARARAFNDRHGLVAGAGVIRQWTVGTQEWHVWVCDVARGGSGSELRHPSEYASIYNEQVTPYFEWLSQGAYRPKFVGQRILNAPGVTDGPQQRERCREQAVRDETARGHPALIVDTSGYGGGEAAPELEWGSEYGKLWPREITGGVAWVGGNSGVGVVAHEMGHVLSFPHSYSGDRTRTSNGWWHTVTDEYDNPMDLMSGASGGLGTGTPAINRYAAGWIPPEQVAVHDRGYESYALRPVGDGGVQMLVIPAYEGAGVFYALGARVRNEYDQNIPAEGVEVYVVNQQGDDPPDSRYGSCENGSPIGEWCWGLGRRTKQYSGSGGTRTSTGHVRPAGSARFELDDWWLQVRSRVGDAFVVRVWDRNIPESGIDWGCDDVHRGSFCDDDGNVHEAGIETIAEAGVTKGCRPDYFCPERTILRRQMAAFLHRAVRHADRSILGLGVRILEMADVPEDAWYRPYAEWATSWGGMTVTDGRFRPDEVVSRADMALMLAETFEKIEVADEPGNLFADTGGTTVEATLAAEALHRLGITAGCGVSPLRFCPDQPVTRAQMASFFSRVLALY